MNIAQLLDLATAELGTGSAARREAEILLGHALQANRAFLYANPGAEVTSEHQARLQNLVQSRGQGTPIAYLTGKRSFWSLELNVTPSVLIPRPETELLVEQALERIPAGSCLRVVDLGTGSGAIALALAQERPECEVHATDCSAGALLVAQENARANDLEAVQFHLGSWTEALTGQFDLVVSNPPYIPENDPHLQQGDCRFEPRMALASGADGLAAIRHIAREAYTFLAKGGYLLLEHGHDQGEAVRQILGSSGYSEIKTYRDLAGIERVGAGRKP